MDIRKIGNRPYRLNSDGTANRLGDGDPKPSTTKVVLANTEPEENGNADALGHANTVVGGVSEMAEIGADKLGGIAKSAGKEAVAGSEEAAQLSGAAGMAEGAATTFKVIGKAAGVLDAGLAWKEEIEHPSVGNLAKAAFKTAMIGVRTNTIVTAALVISDLTGFYRLGFRSIRFKEEIKLI
jgi:hypothetical protein